MNVFLVLNKSIAKTRHATLELCKYVFGNVCKERREFVRSGFGSMIDKQNRRIALNFRNGLPVTKDNVIEYYETSQEFLQAAMRDENSASSCAIDLLSSTPVSEQ